jgi:hypothetical protein
VLTFRVWFFASNFSPPLAGFLSKRKKALTNFGKGLERFSVRKTSWLQRKKKYTFSVLLPEKKRERKCVGLHMSVFQLKEHQYIMQQTNNQKEFYTYDANNYVLFMFSAKIQVTNTSTTFPRSFCRLIGSQCRMHSSGTTRTGPN